jgi:hypothetical protein
VRLSWTGDDEDSQTDMLTLYFLLWAINLKELRSNESYDALLQSISDWEASITTLCSLAEDLKQDHEPVFAGLW